MMLFQSQMRGFSKYGSQMTKEFDPAIDYYAILGIDSTATETQILEGFRAQIRIYHPENNNDIISQEYLNIKNAFSVLGHKETREAYDLKRSEQTSSGGLGDTAKFAAAVAGGIVGAAAVASIFSSSNNEDEQTEEPK